MAQIACFGELMMRLNPEGFGRFTQASRFEVSYAGGEANVAVSLSQFGHRAYFLSVLPENDLGQCAINELRRYGADTSRILRGGPRLGIYFVEKGASQRGSKVVYDRAGSSIAVSKRGDYDWDALLKGVEWFHFTGITPALGGELPEITKDALEAARRLGIPVSCDLNYRGKLWTRDQAQRTMSELMPYVKVLIANEEDAYDVFGIQAKDTDVEGGNLNHEGYQDVAEQLIKRFGFEKVAITLRTSVSASLNHWSGMLYTDGRAYFAKEYAIQLVDRVGGGDSFGAGLIHSLLGGKDPQSAIEYAVAASCLKQTIEHDFNLVSEAEVNALAKGKGAGRVQR